MTTPIRAAAAVAVLCLVTAACGGTADRDASPTPTGAADDDAFEVFEPGPLEELLGWVGGSTVHELVVDQTWRENRTAACMAELGFEYWPAVPATGDVVAGTGPSRGSPEFVAEYGYGVWVSPEDDFTFSWETDTSANTEYRAAMSEAEGAAYDEALFGPVIAEDSDGTATRSGGCAEAADNPSGSDAVELSAVRDEAYAFLAAIPGDPRLGEVDADWAACLADAGFTFASPQAAEESVWTEYLELVDGGGTPAPEFVTERAEAERLLAAADYGCRASTDWTARHRAIELEIQQEYVDAHQADLDALAEAMTEG